MSRKGVYLYGQMDSWKRFEKTWLPDKGDLYSNLNMKYIKIADYKHAKKYGKTLKQKT